MASMPEGFVSMSRRVRLTSRRDESATTRARVIEHGPSFDTIEKWAGGWPLIPCQDG